jgi:hypothetical protein
VRNEGQETLPAVPSPMQQDKRRSSIRTLGIIDLDNTGVEFLFLERGLLLKYFVFQ